MSDALLPGTYRLCKAIENPKPDRRANQHRLTTWRYWAVWPENMVFLVEDYPGNTQRLTARGGLGCFWPHDPAWSVLVPLLERVEEQASDFILRRCDSQAGRYALQILDRLQISIPEIERHLTEIEQEEIADEMADGHASGFHAGSPRDGCPECIAQGQARPLP
jgi:hypothetical protein